MFMDWFVPGSEISNQNLKELKNLKNIFYIWIPIQKSAELPKYLDNHVEDTPLILYLSTFLS